MFTLCKQFAINGSLGCRTVATSHSFLPSDDRNRPAVSKYIHWCVCFQKYFTAFDNFVKQIDERKFVFLCLLSYSECITSKKRKCERSAVIKCCVSTLDLFGQSNYTHRYPNSHNKQFYFYANQANFTQMFLFLLNTQSLWISYKCVSALGPLSLLLPLPYHFLFPTSSVPECLWIDTKTPTRREMRKWEKAKEISSHRKTKTVYFSCLYCNICVHISVYCMPILGVDP